MDVLRVMSGVTWFSTVGITLVSLATLSYSDPITYTDILITVITISFDAMMEGRATCSTSIWDSNFGGSLFRCTIESESGKHDEEKSFAVQSRTSGRGFDVGHW